MLRRDQGRSDGGISGYIPPNQSTLNFLCGCFVSLTQDKLDIVQFIPTQIKFLATPLDVIHMVRYCQCTSNGDRKIGFMQKLT